jgi:THUMP domain
LGTVLLRRRQANAKLHQHLYCITDVEQFAIRPTIRNNDVLNRDVVIKTVADAVGRLSSSHSVDLTNYDCLILVEVYRVSYLCCQESCCIVDEVLTLSDPAERLRYERRWKGIREAEAFQFVPDIPSTEP